MKTIKQITIVILITSLLQIIGCSNYQDEPNVKCVLDKMENRYENIAMELGESYWDFYSGESIVDLKTPKDKFYKLLTNDTLNQTIDYWYPRITELKDTILQKRVEIWHRTLLSAKVEYDSEIMKLRNELEERLSVASQENNIPYDFETKMLELVKLRNKKSVDLGFENYVELTFAVNGLDYQWFINFVETMEKSTLPAYQKLVNEIKAQNNLDEFTSKDFTKAIKFFNENNSPTKVKYNNTELIRISLNNIGIDFDKLPTKLVEEQLPAGVGGQGLMINIPNDFRAAMTLNTGIHIWMHEMGHGLQGLFNSIESPILKGYEWIPGNVTACFAEGMAETSAWFTRNVNWQKEYTNLTDEEILNKKMIVNQYAPLFIRFHLHRFMREVELYLNPERPYNNIQIEAARKYYLVEGDQIETEPIENIRFVSYPLYLQNYLFADMIACQVHETLKNKFGEKYAFNNEVGNYLINYFYKTGEYYSFENRMINGTDRPLDVDTYLTYYGISKD